MGSATCPAPSHLSVRTSSPLGEEDLVKSNSKESIAEPCHLEAEG